MKRKKWSELEEKTLITKYSSLVLSGTLKKMKTREKKFKPIADHVNSVHHLRHPTTFPFRWSWRDVSVKIQNMRHQYLGVKMKIRVGVDRFCWEDGDDHWENFSLYRGVFGDVEVDERESGEEDEEEIEKEVVMEVVRMREEAVMREDRRRDREEERETRRREMKEREREIRWRVMGGEDRGEEDDERERRWSDFDHERGKLQDTLSPCDDRDLEIKMKRHYREIERRSGIEQELKRRREAEERWEKEEMAWRERLVGMQLEHERQMMQMHAEACQNQMQIIGAMARLVSQFFGPPSDGLGALPPQVLSSLQHHSVGLGGDGKPGSDSPSEFL